MTTDEYGDTCLIQLRRTFPELTNHTITLAHGIDTNQCFHRLEIKVNKDSDFPIFSSESSHSTQFSHRNSINFVFSRVQTSINDWHGLPNAFKLTEYMRSHLI